MGDQDQFALDVDPEALRTRLKELAPPLAEIYAGARELLSTPETPGVAYFLAHAAREIANGLPDWLPGVGRKERRSTANLLKRLEAFSPTTVRAGEGIAEGEISTELLVPRDLLRDISDALGAQKSRSASTDAVRRLFEWLGPGNKHLGNEVNPLIREWMALRKWFEAANHARRSRDARVPEPQQAVEQFRRFERVLDALLKSFWAGRQDLDVILADSDPERLPEILRLIVPDEQRRYFFERLAGEGNSAWLEPLCALGFFEGAPAPAWSAAPYLIRMAAEPAVQEKVATIVLRMLSQHQISHWLVQKDLVDIALRLPEHLAAGVSRKMRRWRGGPTGSVALKLGELAVRLVRGGQAKDGMALMESLLATRRPAPRTADDLLWLAEPEPRIGRWGLAEVIRRTLPEFISATGIDGFGLVCRSLAKALSKRPEAADSAIDDGSHVWHQRIEDRTVEDTYAPKGLLAAVARSAFQLQDEGVPISSLVQSLKPHRWEAFQRLAQYLLIQSPVQAPDALRAELLDRRQFNLFRREYRMLLEAGFGQLAVRDQATILEWIETGQDRERIRQHLEWNGREATAEDVESTWRWWQWHWLGPLAKHLPPTWRNRQRDLNAEFGEPPRAGEPEFRSSSAQIGEREGPLTSGEVQSLSVEDIAARYREWHPPRQGRPVLPDDGTVLTGGVAADPQRFASVANVFENAPPTAVRAVFRGLERALREGRTFEWDRVLRLAAWTVAQRPIEWDQQNPFREEEGWEWTRGALVGLLQVGLARAGMTPPTSHRKAIWDLIGGLRDDPPLNRAEAIGAAIHYAHWLKPAAGDMFENTPEVAAFLESQLDHPERAARVHEEFGEWLAFLAYHSATWTSGNLGKILPPRQDLWEAALKAHLRGRRLSPRLFNVLKDLYIRAVEQLQPPEPEKLLGVKTDSTYVQEGLADHIMALYRWGTLDETGSMHILDSLFENASAELRRYALNSVGRSLQNESGEARPAPDVELARLQNLWVSRMSRLREDPRVREELPAFGSWFASGQFDEEWSLAQLMLVLRDAVVANGAPILDQDGVMSRLAALVQGHPAQVARILEHLAQRTDYAYWAYGWEDEIRRIIGGAIRSGDPEAQRAVIGFLDRLGALGVRNVSQLVGASHELDDPLAIPYFLWDQPSTVVQFRDRLSGASAPERDRLLGLLLREASDTDVWRFTSPDEVLARWSGIEKHLGRRRKFWTLLLKKWQEQGLLAR